jgi:hypothetical protein
VQSITVDVEVDPSASSRDVGQVPRQCSPWRQRGAEVEEIVNIATIAVVDAQEITGRNS